MHKIVDFEHDTATAIMQGTRVLAIVWCPVLR